MFIVFEGVEGAGKSSQLALLQHALTTSNISFVSLKEPGGTPMGEAARSILLDPAYAIAPLSELFLLNASRHQLVQDKILPALDNDQHVICDRYVASSIAYQTYGRGLPLELVQRVCHDATDGLEANITILLDLDPATGLERVAARGQVDRLEQADLAFHQRVRHGFLTQAEKYAGWHVIDATASPDEIHQHILAIVMPFMCSQASMV